MIPSMAKQSSIIDNNDEDDVIKDVELCIVEDH